MSYLQEERLNSPLSKIPVKDYIEDMKKTFHDLNTQFDRRHSELFDNELNKPKIKEPQQVKHVKETSTPRRLVPHKLPNEEKKVCYKT